MMPKINFNDSAVIFKHFDILLSAIDSQILDVKLNNNISKNDLIIGPLVIATMTKIPIIPTAFFVILIEPITLSVASPNNFPTMGTVLLTTVFATLEVMPSTPAESVPSSERIPYKNNHHKFNQIHHTLLKKFTYFIYFNIF